MSSRSNSLITEKIMLLVSLYTTHSRFPYSLWPSFYKPQHWHMQRGTESKNHEDKKEQIKQRMDETKTRNKRFDQMMKGWCLKTAHWTLKHIFLFSSSSFICSFRCITYNVRQKRDKIRFLMTSGRLGRTTQMLEMIITQWTRTFLIPM